jgi:hypothetical protein
MAFSTGVSLLPVGGSLPLKDSIRTFLQMSSGTNYTNQVTGVTATSVSGGVNSQTTTGQLNSNLGSYHLFNHSGNAGTSTVRTILNSQVTPELSGNVSNDISVCFWLKGDTDGGFGASLDGGNGSGSGNRFMLFGTGSSLIGGDIYNCNGVGVRNANVIVLYRDSTSTLTTTWTTTSTWRFYVFNFQYNPGSLNYTVTCYINGGLQTNSYNIGRFDVADGWAFDTGLFAAANSVDFQNNCGMDNLSIQKRQLSQAEIDHLYNSGNGRNYSDITM